MKQFKLSRGTALRSLVIKFVALAIISLFVAACAPAAPQAGVPEKVVETVVVEKEVEVEKEVVVTATPALTEKRDSVVVAMSGGLSTVTSLDPTASINSAVRFTVVTHIYDPLLLWDTKTEEWRPMLAESWETLEPGHIRFHLRPNVKFHNGSPFGADDVKFTIDRILDPDVASPARGFFAVFERAEVVDDLTVDVIGAPASILRYAGMLQPVDKQTYEEVGPDEYNLNPVGTGPYKFVEWVPQEFVTLEANSDYWGDVPKIKTATFRHVSEAATKVAMLYAGEADIIDLVPPHLAGQIDSQPNFDIRTAGSVRANFVTINTFQEPFNDVRVRKAMAYAINWQEILNELYAGEGKLLTSTGASTVPLYNHDLTPYPYDPDKARELLAEAGYPDGFETTFDTPDGWFFLDKEASQVIVDNLADVGIKVEFWSAERGSFWEKWVNKGSQLSYMACGNVAMDPVMCLRLHYHSNVRGIYYNHPDIEELIDAYEVESDPVNQEEIMHQIHKFVHDNVPYIPGYEVDQIFAANSNLKWEPNADERIYLHDAEWQ